MNENSVFFMKKMRESKELEAQIQAKAKDLVGRNDAVERLAEHLQDMCPSILCIEIDAETCAKYEHKCGIDFTDIAREIIYKLDPIRVVV